MNSTTPPYDVLATVDLGSNSFRLEIGRAQDADRGAHIERVGYWKETVRLAADPAMVHLFANGKSLLYR